MKFSNASTTRASGSDSELAYTGSESGRLLAEGVVALLLGIGALIWGNYRKNARTEKK